MSLQIRVAFDQDIEELMDIFRRSVSVLGPRAYTPEQVDAWLAGMPEEASWTQRFHSQRHAWLAELNGEPAGWIELEGGMHIDYFYVAPVASGTDAAPALYATAEVYARSNGALSLYTEASKLLKPFLERRNWYVSAIEIVNQHGVDIERYRMGKQLVDFNGAYVRSYCERCYRALPPGEARFACKLRDTYCESCFEDVKGECPACGNQLAQIA